ncbi:hypothetical protein A3SI_07234 [Nitritalea halalkaliphila LW7]|uniref:Bacterial surface antigen (D15) domain-containing protein n=1 Tax=Nitritalea halalkaliphila LW7 TaxID=1189621 RepID=I5C5I9_9BACT|nr:BamA/TamA family outer membrane protein [Nitritalea halalkaliphila]EIM77091.1 hypothetical protein A3SI_07234 [Nitritalea halalkaliphila LW7]
MSLTPWCKVFPRIFGHERLVSHAPHSTYPHFLSFSPAGKGERSFYGVFLLQTALFLAFSNPLQAQDSRPNFAKRYLNGIFNDTTDIRQPQFIIYPTLAFAPETSWEIGVSPLYVYYARRDTSNRLSEINGFAFVTLENQYGLWLDHANYTHENKWFFLGSLRVQTFPLKYFGIGMDVPLGPENKHLAIVDANQIQFKERVLRKVSENFFVGPEFDFQRFSSVRFLDRPEAPAFERPQGDAGSTNFGIGWGLVWDERHNVLNVRHGNFHELAYLRYHPALSTFDFHTVISDNRIFRTLRPNQVLAIQALGVFNAGEVPFNQLGLLGGESLMRGYYLGRFRDKHYLAGQVEYRFLPLPLGFTKRLGAAVFAGAGSVAPRLRPEAFTKLAYSGGAGLRFLLFPKKDIYTRLDYARTPEGSGVYFFIGEAF